MRFLFFKTQKERDQEADADLVKRSQNLGVKPEILLDLEAREKWRKTIKSLTRTFNTFLFIYFIKLYLHYRMKIQFSQMLIGSIVMSSEKIAQSFNIVVNDIANHLVD
jgi:hypothetical protein